MQRLISIAVKMKIWREHSGSGGIRCCLGWGNRAGRGQQHQRNFQPGQFHYDNGGIQLDWLGSIPYFFFLGKSVKRITATVIASTTVTGQAIKMALFCHTI